MSEQVNVIGFEDFLNVDIRSGTVVKVEDFPKARKPAYKIWVDFGGLGIRQTSAQVTHLYNQDTLIGKQVMGCVNLGTKNIGGFVSEFLLLGFGNEEGQIVLASPEQIVPNGKRLM